ncbi:hypothetical protein R5R35_012544 [Gryllus longicercus]|uniref:tRNA (guanine(26)-N(2))-dimethyltransferase n=1 Tax=Gryllus longicercus TaxID=2509291 RepID=A0AAN9VMT4_9ORTH|nr:Probable tRNA (guanine(26)-N(2))-dimethyltransferase [Gryllus bimaculatus]
MSDANADVTLEAENPQDGNVSEFDIKIRGEWDITTPKKSEVFYNKAFALNRAIISTALAAYMDLGVSVFDPVRCLDGIGSTGIGGLLWKKYFPTGINVTINDTHPKAYEYIKENATQNNLEVTVLNKDTCVLLHEQTFNFISLDCHTEAAFYFDSIFRNLPKFGFLAITTKDDASLHGMSPKALRNYGGFISRTAYSKELAIRLFLAALARAAALHNKDIEVLCSVSWKSSFTVLVMVKRGAKKSLSNIRRLIHCNMCEDRAFYPISNHPIENPSSLLGCGCPARMPGKVAIELGPVWCAEIFNVDFLSLMLSKCKKFPWQHTVEALLQQLLNEARCSSSSCIDTLTDEKVEPPNKKLRLSSDEDTIEQAPTFYFNLHRHSPKGPQLLRVEKAVQCLQKKGFRASRTHFDPEAVRTNASLKDLVEILRENSSIK